MKKTINGKRYDTNTCETLGEISRYNNGNYAGCINLLRANNGVLLIHGDSNGQDLYFHDFVSLFDDSEHDFSIDDFEMDEYQEERCVELGLIEKV
jgi:hypothetical protein